MPTLVIRMFLTIASIMVCSAIHYPVCGLAETLDELSMTAAYLRENNRFGSGFLVRGDHPFLVTAEHVANLLNLGSSITVRGTNDTAISLKLSELVPGAERLAWEKHHENDVAVLRLQSIDKLGFLDKRFYPIQQFPASAGSPPRDRTVLVMGFPTVLGTTGRFSPIMTEAKTASGLLRMARFDTHVEATFFVLEKRGIGGFSGGPVFMMGGSAFREDVLSTPGKDNPTLCVGLVHGAIGDTGGTLAAIVPANVIVDTIKSAGGLQK